MWQTTHITLLQRLADGHDQAWRDFHTRYGELIRGYCSARGVQSSDADDILQDVLMSISKALPNFTYDPAKGRFRGYLKVTTIHAIVRRSRQNRALTGLENIEPTEAGSDDAGDQLWEAQWRRYHLRRAMNTLQGEFSQRDLEAFDRYAVLGEDVASVTKDLAISPENLYQIKSRITRRLTSLIDAQIQEEG